MKPTKTLANSLGFQVKGTALFTTLPVPKTAKEAFDQSIRKWEVLKILTEAGVRVDERGTRTCGLCRFAGRHTFVFCEKCPLAIMNPKYTGCNNTPYATAIIDREKREIAFLRRMRKKWLAR